MNQPRLHALVSGTWRIEPVDLDGVPTYRVKSGRYLIAYCRTPAEVESVLAQHGKSIGDFVSAYAAPEQPDQRDEACE